ncbi:phosphoenolpyruvate--protein phosphotransferase [Lentisphaerota bacterium ZTH]|nr:phosphoenolpyruvate--protein phosphotransferase [Lentisphaerota bacterium]WET07182.1 phosphoenolpyruvate--protein phosphotransferase [Lentisphaerota bacterium ZTH]
MADTSTKEKVYHGIAASPGIAIGRVLLIKEHNTSFTESSDEPIKPEQVDAEVQRFNIALDKTREELLDLQRRIQKDLDTRDASIFDAHLLIVDDQMLLNEVEDMVKSQHKSADYAFYKVIGRYIAAISVMPDKYIKERAADIKDVASRVLANLRNTNRPALDHLREQQVVIARDLTPSDTALLDRDKVQAFAIESGSNTSHTAILARSMQIPAVVGIPADVFKEVKNNDEVIVDGFIGTVIANPTEKTREIYQLKAEEEGRFYIDLIRESRLRPETVDGFTVQLASNIESISDVQAAKKFGTSGVGLFRTEYMYMNSQHLPSEEEQFASYKKLALEMNGEPVVVRTLDVGGDKLDQKVGAYAEQNPFLGLRAIRLCLHERRDIFRTQLRALLRAGKFGNLKIMFPMISCVEEVMEAHEFLQEVKEELLSEKAEFAADIDTGIMIETPAAALMADQLAQLVDFFSIGTNDLIQYTMAIDRSNERVAYLYHPSHPVILKQIKHVVNAAKRNRIWVSLCGQMASNPKYTPLLVGLGLHELSMSPISLGAVRRIIRKLRMHDAELAVNEAIKCSTAEEALEISLNLLRKISPEVTNLALRGL